MKKAESKPSKRIVRVGFTDTEHALMEEYQKYFKIVHERKISKEQIIVNIFNGELMGLKAEILALKEQI